MQPQMLNPAWQPAQDQAERLINISHHFLSELAQSSSPHSATAGTDLQLCPSRGSTQPDNATVQLPVLTATRDDFPGGHAPDYLLNALTRQLNLPNAAADPNHPPLPETEWELQRCELPEQAVQAHAHKLVLILIDASLSATRNAYALIKTLAQREVARVAVVYRSGTDVAAARRCYRRLAVGSIRFLNQPLINLGCLPEPGPHFAAALAHAAQVIRSQPISPPEDPV